MFGSFVDLLFLGFTCISFQMCSRGLLSIGGLAVPTLQLVLIVGRLRCGFLLPFGFVGLKFGFPVFRFCLLSFGLGYL